MGSRSNDLTRWQRGREGRTESLAGMIATHAGREFKLPGWLLPILVADLFDLRWDTFENVYYLRRRDHARAELLRLLTPEEQSALATWHMHGDALGEAESEQQR